MKAAAIALFLLALPLGAQINVADEDSATLTVGDATVSENAGFAAVSVQLSAPAGLVTLRYTTVDGTATAGPDYEARTGTLTFTASSSEESISIPVRSDLLLSEANETFEVVVSEVSGATVVRDRAVVTIVNAEPPVPLVTVDEWLGLESSDATFTLRLDAPTFRDVTFVAATDPTGQYAKPGLDFVAKTQTLLIPAGETSTTFTVDIIDDAVVEGRELFVVYLTGLTNARFSPYPRAVGWIEDNDGPMLTIDDATVVEGDAGITILRARVHLDRTAAAPIRVSYSAYNQTAHSDRDFVRSSGTLTINPGEREKFIEVGILGDRSIEPDETFIIRLSAAQGAGNARALATCTIVNDDAAPPKRRSARH